MSNSWKVLLDADHTVHLLCVICDYLNHIRLNIEDYLEGDETDSRIKKSLELMELFYQAGNIEGRLLSNNVNETDLELIEEWEKELNGGQSGNKENVGEEDFTLVFSSQLPLTRQYQKTFITARIRRSLKNSFPLCDPSTTWLTEDAQEYGSIQLILQILVSPEYADDMCTAVQKALSLVDMRVDDMWGEEA
jgi:hypothetical protein